MAFPCCQSYTDIHFCSATDTAPHRTATGLGAWPRPWNPGNRAAAATASQTTNYTLFPISWQVEQTAMTWSSSATSAMFTYTTHLSKYRSGHTAQVRSMGFMHATHGLASMVDFGQSDITRTLTQVSLRSASTQVSSKFPAGFGPASIMDFWLN